MPGISSQSFSANTPPIAGQEVGLQDQTGNSPGTGNDLDQLDIDALRAAVARAQAVADAAQVTATTAIGDAGAAQATANGILDGTEKFTNDVVFDGAGMAHAVRVDGPGGLDMFTDDAAAGDTDDVWIGSGQSVADNSGNIVLQPGAAGATRGRVWARADLKVDNALGVYNGISDSNAMVQYDVLCGIFNATGRLTLADADTEPTSRVIGICVSPGAQGAACSYVTAGVYTVGFDAAPDAADYGKPVYLSVTEGKATLTAPGSGKMKIRIGYLIGGNGILTVAAVALQIGDAALVP